MQTNTAVLPPRFNPDEFRKSDPRFYARKDILLIVVRNNSSSIAPENAMVVPILRQVERVTLQKAQPLQSIRPIEGARKRRYISGRI